MEMWVQASDFEGGMTVSGPSSSRMTRRRGAGGFSWYWYTPGVEALMNFPEAIWRSALTCSAAERATATMVFQDSICGVASELATIYQMSGQVGRCK